MTVVGSGKDRAADILIGRDLRVRLLDYVQAHLATIAAIGGDAA